MRKEQKKRNTLFYILLALYAVALFVGLHFGLKYLWNYLDAYEHTRIEYTLEAYMESVTPEMICSRCDELVEKIDTRLQTPQQARKIIADAVSSKIRYARNLSKSTPEKQVYTLRCDGKNIGSVTLCQVGESTYGFTPWEVAEDNFDLSFLLSQPEEFTVPAFFSVYLNGEPLSEDLIAERDIPIKRFSAFGDYDYFPKKVRYSYGSILGPAELTMVDGQGRDATKDTEEIVYLNNCTDEERAKLDDITKNFLSSYVAFASVANNNINANLMRVSKYVVHGSPLYNRIVGTVYTLTWSADHFASITSIDTALYMKLTDDLYLCDVTYDVKSTNLGKTDITTTNVQILFRVTQDGLRAEAMM